MGVKRQRGNRKRRFSVLSGATSSEPSEIWPTLLDSINVITYQFKTPCKDDMITVDNY